MILSSFFLFNACNKEINFSSGSLDYRDTQNYGNSYILSNIQFDQQGNILLGNGNAQGTLQHANIEFQREVSNYIYYQSSKQKIDSINELYGTPLWEIATIDFWNQTTSNYIISVPFIKNNKLAGVLIYQSLENEKKAYLFDDISFEQTLEKTRENSTFFKEMIIPVTKYGIYQFLITNSIHPKYNIWINLAINNSQNTLNDRNFLRICFEIAYSTYEPGTYTETIHIEERCIWASLGFGFFTGFQWSNDYEVGGGNNNGVNNNNKNNKNKKLECLVAIIDFMAREDIMNMIENNSLSDPCNPEMSTEQILEQLANEACNKGINLKNLKNINQLYSDIANQGDRIITHNSLNNCPQMACIWKNMINGNLGTNYTCDIMAGFEPLVGSTPGWVLKVAGLDFSTRPDYDPNSFARTYPSSDGLITIVINTLNCIDKSDPLNLFETLQHELVHAKIFSELFKKYGFNGVDHSLNYYQAFEQLVIAEYGNNATSDQHTLMLEKYLNEMVRSLIEVTGVGTFDANYQDYVGLILYGFPKEILESCGYSLGVVADKYHSYQVFAHNNPSIYDNIKYFCK